MKTKEEQRQARSIPQLRVFCGEEKDEGQGRRPPNPTREARREWLRTEAYWAGRNRAGRLSARLAA